MEMVGRQNPWVICRPSRQPSRSLISKTALLCVKGEFIDLGAMSSQPRYAA